MKTPQLERYEGPDGRAGFMVRTPYQDDFVEQLKALLPSGDRRWWEDSKAWWVAEEHEDLLRHLILDAFGELELLDASGCSEIETRGGGRIRIKQERLFD